MVKDTEPETDLVATSHHRITTATVNDNDWGCPKGKKQICVCYLAPELVELELERKKMRRRMAI